MVEPPYSPHPIHRVGELVQQAGDTGSSSENKTATVF